MSLKVASSEGGMAEATSSVVACTVCGEVGRGGVEQHGAGVMIAMVVVVVGWRGCGGHG